MNSLGVIQNNKGHAIYVTGGAYHKETTVGPNVQLFYNDPINGTSGW
jgi:hypothetical protein